MKTVKVTLNLVPTPEKPKSEVEKRKWSVELGKAPVQDVTIEELVYSVGELQYSFCGPKFKRRWIKQQNFEACELIVIDIDCKLSPKDALARLEEYDLPSPNGIYRTFSDPTDDSLSNEEMLIKVTKFRMIFVLQESISDLKVYNDLVKKQMYVLFPEADKVSATQKFLGGKGVIYFQDTRLLSTIELISAVDLYKIHNHITTPQKLRAAFKKSKIIIPPSLLQKGVVMDGDSIFDEKEIGSKISNDYNIIKGNGKNEPKKIRGFSWDRARKEFQLLNDFISCNTHIMHIELLGLLSGMRRIEGGEKLWKESILNNCMIKNNKINISHWFDDAIESGINRWEFEIADYAPDDPAAERYERLTDIHFRKGMPARKINNYSEIPLDQAGIELEAFLSDALKSDENGKYVLKAATGIGKTEILKKFDLKGCVIAAPTHRLKTEISERFSKENIPFNLVPDDPELPEKVQKVYDELQSIGDYSGAAGYLKMWGDGVQPNSGLNPFEAINLSRQIKNYFIQLEQCFESDTLVITTHKRILFTKFPKHHTYIIDEDPSSFIFEINSISTKDLRKLYNCLEGEDQDKIKKIYDSAKNEPDTNLPSKGFQLDLKNAEEFKQTIDILRTEFDGAIVPFFHCDFWLPKLLNKNDPDGDKKILFVKKHLIDPNKKIILLSATVNQEYCKALFGNIIWKDLSNVEHVGTRIQFSNLSNSRGTLLHDKNKKNLDRINRFIGDLPVITFKKFSELFKTNKLGVHFGNCSGYDEFKGNDLAVIGTPHIPVEVYQLAAAELNIEYIMDDLKMEERDIEHNGYRFKIMTFKHEGLRSIQFHYLESELLQACGRNRTLRENATTYLFSNFPLPGFEQRSTQNIPQPKFISINDRISKEFSRIIPMSNQKIAFHYLRVPQNIVRQLNLNNRNYPPPTAFQLQSA